MDSPMITVLLLALLVVAIGGLLATVYLWLRFHRDTRRPRSRFLLTVCIVSTLIEVGSSVIAVLATRRLLGFESLPYALQATVVSLLFLESGPIIFATVVYLVRRHRLPNRPVVDPDGDA